MTFEEVYKILYKKHKVARWDDVDKELKVRDVTTINTLELFALIDGLKETYAPKIKMTKKEADMLKSLKRTPQIGVGIVDYSGREPKVLLSNESYFVDAWLHPELIEVSDDR